jgi:succinate dehydrogenase hydrophobic membrane anchor protein
LARTTVCATGWLQRITAVVMALYTLVLLFWFFGARDFSYDGWASIFAMQWMKLATFVALLSLFYHAWVGIRDIWMDYVKPVGLRLFLQVADDPLAGRLYRLRGTDSLESVKNGCN